MPQAQDLAHGPDTRPGPVPPPRRLALTPGEGPVLVVDDDAAVRHALKFALELEGLSVRLYQGGEEVLADADLPSTGCLVVDHFMPAMTGVELIEGLRRRAVALPAILITAKPPRTCASAPSARASGRCSRSRSKTVRLSTASARLWRWPKAISGAVDPVRPLSLRHEKQEPIPRKGGPTEPSALPPGYPLWRASECCPAA